MARASTWVRDIRKTLCSPYACPLSRPECRIFHNFGAFIAKYLNRRKDLSVPSAKSKTNDPRIKLSQKSHCCENKSYFHVHSVTGLLPLQRSFRSHRCCRSSSVRPSVVRPFENVNQAGREVEGGCFPKWKFLDITYLMSHFSSVQGYSVLALVDSR